MEMRNAIEGTFLYIDSDTIIAGDLDEINQIKCHIGMVLDKHEIVDTNFNQRVFELNAEKMGYESSFDRKHYNGGMMYVDESAQSYEFFALWRSLYFDCIDRGLLIDQTSLNEANSRLNGIITEIDGKWNVQLDSGLKYIHEGKILHYAGYQPQNEQNIYFNTLPFKICDAELFKRLKIDGRVTDELMNIIKNPKSAFKTSYIVPSDCVAYQLLFSNHFRILKFFYLKLNKLYNLFEKIYKWFFIKIYKRA